MTPHITLDPNGSGALYCEHCAELHPPLSKLVERFIDEARGFVLMHKHCPKPAEVSPQLALPHTEAKPKSVVERCDLCRQLTWDIAAHRCGEEMETEDECSARVVREELGIDGSTDDPAPEIDPPGPYAMFERMYPLAATTTELCLTLAVLLPAGKYPDGVTIWHPSSGIFNAVANWARIEKAHAEVGQREPIAGLTLPRREPMPEQLAELLGEKAKRMKGARPLSSPRKRRNGTGHDGPVNV